MKIFVCWLLLGSFASSIITVHAASRSRRLAHGVEVPRLQFYAVLYKITSESPMKGKLLCGAAIVSTEWALTAAHCFFNQSENAQCVLHNADKLRLFTESLEYGRGIQHHVYAPIIHDYYLKKKCQDPQDYDIALLRLQQPVLSHIPIPLAVNPPEINDVMLICGNGRTENNLISNYTKIINVTVAHSRECEKVIQNIKTFSDRLICGYDGPGENKGICEGDSGDPAIINNKLVGVISFALMPCLGHSPAAGITKVLAYKSWIETKTRKSYNTLYEH